MTEQIRLQIRAEKLQEIQLRKLLRRKTTKNQSRLNYT